MSLDERILQGTSSNLEVTWHVDGTPTDPDGQDTTLGITRADGTVLTAPGTAATRTGEGVYRHPLAPQAELDELTVTWTAEFAGVQQQLRSRVEIIGGNLFTEAQARAFRPRGQATLADADRYPDAAIVAERDRLTDDIEGEHICGVAMVPRYARRHLTGTGTDVLLLPHVLVQRVLSVTLTPPGASPTVLDEADWILDGTTGELQRASGTWPTGRRAVTVAYVHGHERTPGPVQRAALHVAFSRLVGSSIDERATSMSDELGTFQLATAGRGEFQPYGIPQADSVLRRYRLTVPGVA